MLTHNNPAEDQPFHKAVTKNKTKAHSWSTHEVCTLPNKHINTHAPSHQVIFRQKNPSSAENDPHLATEKRWSFSVSSRHTTFLPSTQKREKKPMTSLTRRVFFFHLVENGSRLPNGPSLISPIVQVPAPNAQFMFTFCSWLHHDRDQGRVKPHP